MQEQAKYNAASWVNKFSDFQKSHALTVDLGRTSPATADSKKNSSVVTGAAACSGTEPADSH
jgi:hypothetical protein